MARWLRETAANTRAKGDQRWSREELNCTAHVAFRLEQAADQLVELRGELSLAEEGLANAMHDIERLTAAASTEATESTRLRLRCEALAILLYGPVPERTREHVQRELEACESAVTALRAELAALPEHPTGDPHG